MAASPRFKRADLERIAKKAYVSEPIAILKDKAEELAPSTMMAGRANLADALRQMLPAKLENTAWYKDSQKGNVSSFRRQLATGIDRLGLSKLPLGGYDEAVLEGFRTRREDPTEPVNRARTLDVRKIPVEGGGEEDIGDSFSARAAQLAGVTAADVSRDGLRNIWWFLNAPQALAQVASLQGMYNASGKFRPGRQLIDQGTLRYAATIPAVIAMSVGVGNIGRPKGYKAILPSEEDPRETDTPVGEFLSRYFLGRTGRLLPYDEFKKERPDISEGEYRRYKAYLFDKQGDLNPLDGDFNILSALKGTTSGIHGPEINFMGKAIPALTGIIPTAAAVVGMRKGIRKAGTRLQREGAGFDKVKALELEKKEVQQSIKVKTPEDVEYRQREVGKIDKKIYEQETENSIEALKQALLFGGGYATAGGITGQALESMRRDIGQDD